MDANSLIDNEKEKIGDNPGFDNIVMNPSLVTEFMQVEVNNVNPDDENGNLYSIFTDHVFGFFDFGVSFVILFVKET